MSTPISNAEKQVLLYPIPSQDTAIGLRDLRLSNIAQKHEVQAPLTMEDRAALKLLEIYRSSQ